MLKTKLRVREVAVLMSHLLGAGASNANIDSIYFLTKNIAKGTAGCWDGRLCGTLKCALIWVIYLIYKRNLLIINHILEIVISLDVYCYLHNYPVMY